jgi:hypothetical protein
MQQWFGACGREKPPVTNAASSSELMASVVPSPIPSIVMTTASAPSVMMATTATSHMPMTMSMTALYEDDALAAGERSRVCNWHCGCR